MTSFSYRLGAIQNYRWASVALIAAMILLPVGMVRLGAFEWAAMLATLPIFLALVALTYLRLRNAGLTGWWIVLMLLVLNFGPSWEGLEPLTFHLSHLIHLIPVALGWMVRAPRTVAVTKARLEA